MVCSKVLLSTFGLIFPLASAFFLRSINVSSSLLSIIKKQKTMTKISLIMAYGIIVSMAVALNFNNCIDYEMQEVLTWILENYILDCEILYYVVCTLQGCIIKMQILIRRLFESISQKENIHKIQQSHAGVFPQVLPHLWRMLRLIHMSL